MPEENSFPSHWTAYEPETKLPSIRDSMTLPFISKIDIYKYSSLDNS